MKSTGRWARLRALRAVFLESGKALETDYWQDTALVDLYDQSLGRRIAWKWEAVMQELALRGSIAPLLSEVNTLIDWGCGSGAAAEIFLQNCGKKFDKVYLLDRSVLAADFACKKIAALENVGQATAVQKFPEGGQNVGMVVSHVVNEMPGPEISKIVKAAQMCRFVLWVEPGAPLQSRKVSEIRDQLYAHGFHAWAPCLHSKKCPVLADGHEKDWCHFFADAPGVIHHDPFWNEFAREMEVDLRSNPYSFVLLSKDPPPPFAATARVLQRPAVFKGHAEVQVCSKDGQLEAKRVEKRVDGDLYKALKKDPPLYL